MAARARLGERRHMPMTQHSTRRMAFHTQHSTHSIPHSLTHSLTAFPPFTLGHPRPPSATLGSPFSQVRLEMAQLLEHTLEARAVQVTQEEKARQRKLEKEQAEKAREGMSLVEQRLFDMQAVAREGEGGQMPEQVSDDFVTSHLASPHLTSPNVTSPHVTS